MLGIFQADLPIGRRLWLLALILIVSGLIAGEPIKLLNDPAAFAIALLIYAGHAFLLGVLYSLAPMMLVVILDLVAMYRRSRAWGTSSILFEGYRYEWFSDALATLAFILAAVLATVRFGDESLVLTGTIGLIIILIAEAFDLERLFFLRPNELTLELSSASDKTSTVRLFFAGDLLAETTLDRDVSKVVQQLLFSKWKFLPGAPQAPHLAWLQKNEPGVGAAARLFKRLEIIELSGATELAESQPSPQATTRKPKRQRRRRS